MTYNVPTFLYQYIDTFSVSRREKRYHLMTGCLDYLKGLRRLGGMEKTKEEEKKKKEAEKKSNKKVKVKGKDRKDKGSDGRLSEEPK